MLAKVNYNRNDFIIASYFEAEISDKTVKLLPFGHSRSYPLKFNIESKEILNGELNFYNEVFFKNFSIDKKIDPSICEAKVIKTYNTISILNILDYCFGHSLLKLFSAINFANLHPESDYLFIIPKALMHFCKTPMNVNYLIVNAGFAKLETCEVLNAEVDKIVCRYTEVYYQEISTYGQFDYDDLVTGMNLFNDNNITTSKRNIVFYYRKDFYRMWKGKFQSKNVIRLFETLRPFFSMEVEFIVLGDKDNFKFPTWISDQRTNGFSAETDWHYNKIFSNSIICFGLTGSHMLFPSLLCEYTVHLHNISKYKNMAEDVVMKLVELPIFSTYKHVYYFGNHNCSDISHEKLATLSMSHYLGLMEKKYKTSEAIDYSQKAWIKENNQMLNIDKLNSYLAAQIRSANSKVRSSYYLQKLFK